MSVDYIGGIVLHQKYGGRGMDVSQKCVRRVGYTLCIRNGYMYALGGGMDVYCVADCLYRSYKPWCTAISDGR